MAEEEKKPNIENLIEEPEEVKSDTKVSKAGEEIPEGFEPKIVDEEFMAEEPPKVTEPVVEPTPPDTGKPPELSPLEQAFIDKGLDKQFGSIEEMMERVPVMNRHIDDLSVERKKLRALQEEATPEPEPEKLPSSDEFYADPISAINKMMDSREGATNKRLNDMEADTFISSKADYEDMEPLMEEALRDNPWMAAGGTKALKALYQMAKGRQLSKLAGQPAPAPAPKKASAESSVGKKSPPVDKNDPSYWVDKTPKEIEDELGVTPRYRD